MPLNMVPVTCKTTGFYKGKMGKSCIIFGTVIEVDNPKILAKHTLMDFVIKDKAGMLIDSQLWNDSLDKYKEIIVQSFSGTFHGYYKENGYFNVTRVKAKAEKTEAVVDEKAFREKAAAYEEWLKKNNFVRALRRGSVVVMSKEDTFEIDGKIFDTMDFMQEVLGAEYVKGKIREHRIHYVSMNARTMEAWKKLKTDLLNEAITKYKAKD